MHLRGALILDTDDPSKPSPRVAEIGSSPHPTLGAARGFTARTRPTVWRRWTGIEPAERGSLVPTALKAAESTRYPDTSAFQRSGRSSLTSHPMTPPVLFCTESMWNERGGAIRAIDPTVEVVLLVGDELISAPNLTRINIAFFSPDAWPEHQSHFMGACLRAPNLSWLQTFSSGTNHPVYVSLRDRDVTVTSAAGAAAPSIAQTVMLYLLALARDLPQMSADQAARRWAPAMARDLGGMRLGVVGLGAIGSEVARLGAAFDMEVIGLRRSVRGDESCTTWPTSRLIELLKWADAIAVSAPLTDETRGMFDAQAFASMKPGALFVNVGRGDIIDENALIDALRSGHIGGAGLDVFTVEPLPDESPLWALPNVIITPHSSGVTDRSDRAAVDLFIENFRRFTLGEPLVNNTSGQRPIVMTSDDMSC